MMRRRRTGSSRCSPCSRCLCERLRLALVRRRTGSRRSRRSPAAGTAGRAPAPARDDRHGDRLGDDRRRGTGTAAARPVAGSTGGGAAGGWSVRRRRRRRRRQAAGTCAKATKATDTGATANKLTIATLADISGVQPGLFQSAHQAARAAAAYINSHRRHLRTRRSSRCSSTARPTPAGTAPRCSKPARRRSRSPDRCRRSTTAARHPDRHAGSRTSPRSRRTHAKYQRDERLPRVPERRPEDRRTRPAKYIAKRFPDVIKKAAILWLNQAVTKNNAAARKKVWETRRLQVHLRGRGAGARGELHAVRERDGEPRRAVRDDGRRLPEHRPAPEDDEAAGLHAEGPRLGLGRLRPRTTSPRRTPSRARTSSSTRRCSKRRTER